MNVGVIVPCHIDDWKTYYPYCLHGLRGLNPQPNQVFLDVNDGSEGLKIVRRRLFDKAFKNGCDVVLQCSADFYLRSDILKYVSESEVVAFTPLFRHPCDLTMALHRILLPSRTWSGCYSLPRNVWFRIRDKFDGSDFSVSQAVKCWRVKSFEYFTLRAYGKDSTRRLVNGFSLSKRLMWQFIRMRAIA